MVTIRIERARPIGYLIVEQIQDGDENGAGRIDGRSVLVQTDWDYPSTAESFGFSLSSIRPQRCGICQEQESESPAWSGTHRYGPVEHGEFRPCDHSETDGTIVCASCGLETGAMISAAAEFLDEHAGSTADDPGYFAEKQEQDA